jgi:hypothetical protein
MLEVASILSCKTYMPTAVETKYPSERRPADVDVERAD